MGSTVDLETLEPHIIANYTTTLQKVSVVCDEYLLSYSRKSVVLIKVLMGKIKDYGP